MLIPSLDYLHELIGVLIYEHKNVRSASSPWKLSFLVLGFVITVSSQVK